MNEALDVLGVDQGYNFIVIKDLLITSRSGTAILIPCITGSHAKSRVTHGANHMRSVRTLSQESVLALLPLLSAT